MIEANRQKSSLFAAGCELDRFDRFDTQRPGHEFLLPLSRCKVLGAHRVLLCQPSYMMMRAQRLSLSLVWLIGGAGALSITRRSLAIGTAASAATPIGLLREPKLRRPHVVEGSAA